MPIQYWYEIEGALDGARKLLKASAFLPLEHQIDALRIFLDYLKEITRGAETAIASMEPRATPVVQAERNRVDSEVK